METLEQEIAAKFKGKSNAAIIAIINRGKKNIDDEGYELNRRGINIAFDRNDRCYIVSTKIGEALARV